MSQLSQKERLQKNVWRDRDNENPWPHSVYRIYDAEDHLLYIGCARDVEHRIYMHRQGYASWDIYRGYARHTSVEYPSKVAARAAERKAIHDEAPLLNRQHNPKRWKRVDGQYVPVESSPTQRKAS